MQVAQTFQKNDVLQNLGEKMYFMNHVFLNQLSDQLVNKLTFDRKHSTSNRASNKTGDANQRDAVTGVTVVTVTGRGASGFPVP